MVNTYKCKKGSIFSIAALALLLSCDTSVEPDGSIYLPVAEDTAIIFTHKFNPDDYEEGKQIVVERFSEAIEESGQTRRTYFLSRADSAEVVAISFFHANSSSDEWLNSEMREEVLTALRPLYREPLDVQEYHAERIHNTHGTEDSEPAYLAEKGDEVVLFIHLFYEQSYESGKAIVVNKFSLDIENSGQKLRSYFLDKPENYEVVVASFVHPDSEIEEWLNNEEHRETLDSLSPLHRESLKVAKYIVEGVHNAN